MGEFYKTSKAYKVCYATKKTSSQILIQFSRPFVEVRLLKFSFLKIYLFLLCVCMYVCVLLYHVCAEVCRKRGCLFSELESAGPSLPIGTGTMNPEPLLTPESSLRLLLRVSIAPWLSFNKLSSQECCTFQSLLFNRIE